MISSVANLEDIKIHDSDNLGVFNTFVLTDLAQRCLNKAGKKTLGERMSTIEQREIEKQPDFR